MSAMQTAARKSPRLEAPDGACDTHMHFYDEKYPLAKTAASPPPEDGSVETYRALRQRIGISRTVVVQPTAYGKDNSCTLDGMAALGQDARGVAVVDEEVSDAELRRLDVLVNNAGYGITGSVVETDAAAWDALMAVNVRGVFLCSKYAIPAMKRSGGGTIVNTASVVAAVGIANRAAYCASKGAVAALTRAIAIDHVGDGIRCNAVAPGTIDTPYFDEILDNSADPDAVRKALAARQLLGRLGTPEEIAAGILFLAGDESRFATGTILTLDGGMTAQ